MKPKTILIWGFIHTPFPLHHGRGMSLRVRPRVKKVLILSQLILNYVKVVRA